MIIIVKKETFYGDKFRITMALKVQFIKLVSIFAFIVFPYLEEVDERVIVSQWEE